MQIELLNSGLVASLLTIVAYALGGFGYSLTGLGKNTVKYGGASYDPTEGVYPVLIFAAAGVLVVLFGQDLNPGTLEAFAVFLAFIVDQFRQMIQAASTAYDDERDEGAEQLDAIGVAIREGLEAGDPEQIRRIFQQVSQDYGQPDTKNVTDEADQMRESYRRDGARGVYDDSLNGAFAEEDVIHEPAEGSGGSTTNSTKNNTNSSTGDSTDTSPRLRAHTDDADPATDEEHYVGDGDGDDDNDPSRVVTEGA